MVLIVAQHPLGEPVTFLYNPALIEQQANRWNPHGTFPHMVDATLTQQPTEVRSNANLWFMAGLDARPRTGQGRRSDKSLSPRRLAADGTAPILLSFGSSRAAIVIIMLSASAALARNNPTVAPPNAGSDGPLSSADHNHDGTVTRTEINDFMRDRPYRQLDFVDYLETLNTNADGAMNAGECAGA